MVYAENISHIKERASRLSSEDAGVFLRAVQKTVQKKDTLLSSSPSWMIVVLGGDGRRLGSAVGNGPRWRTILSAGMQNQDGKCLVITVRG